MAVLVEPYYDAGVATVGHLHPVFRARVQGGAKQMMGQGAPFFSAGPAGNY